MNIKIFYRSSVFPSWSGYGLISTPVLLPQGSNPIAVNKYIISYHTLKCIYNIKTEFF